MRTWLARLLPALVLPAFAATQVACGGTGADGPAAGYPHRPHAPLPRPNIILIVLDTARADRMSYAGYPRVTTPFIDRFARDAVDYRRAHAVAPWTLPSHMSMFTGLLPGRHGATWKAFDGPSALDLNGILERSIRFTEPERLLPLRLNRAGYTTVGFTNNAWVAERTGFSAGFDLFVEMWRERRRLRNAYGWLDPALRSSREADTGDAGLTLLRFRQYAAGRDALREPFFLFFNLIDPHYPYSPPPLWRYAFSDDRWLGEEIARFRFAELGMVAGERPVDVRRFGPFYDAELSYVDFIVGRFFAWLKEAGYYDETLVIVTSDHGEHLGEGGRFSHQFSVEEELLAVPLLIKYPGNRDGGTIVEDPLVSPLDVYGTVLHAALGPAADHPATGSMNLAAADTRERTHLVAEYDFSGAYLRLHQERFAPFPLEAHRVTRRVVYTRDGRFVFEDRGHDSVATSAGSADRGPGSGTASGRDRAAAILREYLASLGGGLVKITGDTADESTKDQLRSLGYVK